MLDAVKQKEKNSAERSVSERREKEYLVNNLSKFIRLGSLVLLCVLITVFNPKFVSMDNLINILRQASILLMVASGVTVVILTGGIDLSTGGILAFAGCVCATYLKMDVSPALAIGIGLLTGAGLGAVNGILTGIVGLPSFVATYAMLWLTNGFSLILMQGAIIFGLPPGFRFIGTGYVGFIPVPVIIAATVIVVYHFILNKTVTGRQLYMMGSNSTAAHYSGINVKKVSIIAFALSGLTAAMAGIVMTARLDAAEAGMGEAFILMAIAATVMGGTSMQGGEGSVFGTVIGALILTVIVNGMNLLSIPSVAQTLLTAIVILLAVFMDLQLKKMENV